MAEYPYLRSNKNLPQIFEKIRTAAKPPKFTIAFQKYGEINTSQRPITKNQEHL